MASPRVRIQPIHPSRIKPLSDRDWNIIQMLADGLALPAIAIEIHLTYHYLRQVMTKLYDRTGTWSKSELVAYGFRQGKIQ